MSLNRIIENEKVKRQKSKLLNRFAKINWKLKKKEIEIIFRETFNDFKIDHSDFYISSDLNGDFSDKTYVGYDCIQVAHPQRWTGNVIITKDEKSTNYDRKKEVGSSLSITTNAVGSFDVFLIPSKSDDQLIERESIIVFTTKDPNDLTKKIIHKAIKQFLIFQRVDSVFEHASTYERFYISTLYFFDIRNREKYRKSIYSFSSHWGAVLITALVTFLVAA
ncbi:MAG: hypothetical protein ACI8WB_003894 [Phenylobacterium sp.]|jgi:hypothetical protein